MNSVVHGSVFCSFFNPFFISFFMKNEMRNKFKKESENEIFSKKGLTTRFSWFPHFWSHFSSHFSFANLELWFCRLSPRICPFPLSRHHFHQEVCLSFLSWLCISITMPCSNNVCSRYHQAVDVAPAVVETAVEPEVEETVVVSYVLCLKINPSQRIFIARSRRSSYRQDPCRWDRGRHHWQAFPRNPTRV